MSYSYQETLNGESLSRYKAKLSVVNCKECPYKLPAGVWENNPCMWPDLQYGDVYSYLIESPGNYFFILFFYKFYSVSLLLIITKTK